MRHVFLTVACITLLGCAATGPAYSPVTDAPEKHGVVYVYRQDHFANKLIKPGITVDGKEYAALPSGGYMPFVLPEGEHTFGLLLGKDYEGGSTVKVAVNKTESFVRLETYNEDTDSQTMRRVFRLILEPVETAATQITSCKLVDPNSGKRHSKSILVDN